MPDKLAAASVCAGVHVVGEGSRGQYQCGLGWAWPSAGAVVQGRWRRWRHSSLSVDGGGADGGQWRAGQRALGLLSHRVELGSRRQLWGDGERVMAGGVVGGAVGGAGHIPVGGGVYWGCTFGL